MKCCEESVSEKNDHQYWGYHLILDCKGCNVEEIQSKEQIRLFVGELVRDIDMKAFGEPIIENFANHNPLVAGYSLVQLIETSSITAHFADHTGDAYIDIFSCKPFDLGVAQEVVHRFFHPEKIKITYLTRQA
jgi:S-adenosylmethionine/arginine decarboxylase-like enzyme